jgi:hypothetical protein
MPDSPRTPRRIPKPGPQAKFRGAQLVSATRVRELFVEAKILEKVAAGELTTRVTYEKPASLKRNLPPDTISQCTGYFDQNRTQVAETHRYLFADGTMTQPDPKEVIWQDTLYIYEFR